MNNLLTDSIISNYESDSKILNTLIDNSNSLGVTHRCLYEVVSYCYQNGLKYFKHKELGQPKDFDDLDHKTKQQAKPFGKLIISIYNLCKECHAHGYGNYYPNSGFWFASILPELPFYDFLYLMCNSKETCMVQMWKDRVRCLKSIDSGEVEIKDNPFIKYNLYKYPAGMLLLVESAKNLSSRHRLFEDKYWTPYIQAQQEIVRMLETDSNLSGIKLLHNTQQYQLASKDETGRKTKYKNPKPQVNG